MSKKIIFFFFVLFSTSMFSQGVFITRNGVVTFNASTPLETIKPTNNYVSSVLNSENGEIVFQLNIISFKFEKALMETHFNEKYMESDKFPKSKFIGKVQAWNSDFLDGNLHKITSEGIITIHGIEKTIVTNGTIISRNNLIEIKSSFDVDLDDFNIKIPKLVKDKISKTVDIEVEIKLKKK